MHQMSFGGRAPPSLVLSRVLVPLPLHSHTHMGVLRRYETIFCLGSAQTRWGSLQRSPRLYSCIETEGAYSAPQTPSWIAFSDQKGTKCCLAAGLRLDPLGELTALSQTP